MTWVIKSWVYYIKFFFIKYLENIHYYIILWSYSHTAELRFVNILSWTRSLSYLSADQVSGYVSGYIIGLVISKAESCSWSRRRLHLLVVLVVFVDVSVRNTLMFSPFSGCSCRGIKRPLGARQRSENHDDDSLAWLNYFPIVAALA